MSPEHSDVKGSGVSKGQGVNGEEGNDRGEDPEPGEISVSRRRECQCVTCFRWTAYKDTKIWTCGFHR